MTKRLNEIHNRTTYLNTFDFPHGKNLMPYSLKKVPRWFLDHATHEIQIRIWDSLRSKDQALVLQKIRFNELRKIKKLQSVDSTGETKFLAARPHPRAGIGHQMSSVLAALELAHKNDLTFAISGLTLDWATEFGFTPQENLPEIEISKEIKLSAFNEVTDKKYTKEATSTLAKKYSESILFWAPFNDSKIDLTFGGKLLQERYLRVNSEDRPGKEKLVINVRRARIGELGSLAPIRNLSTDTYFEQILKVMDTKYFQDNVKDIILLGVEIEELKELARKIESTTGHSAIATRGCCDIGAFRLLATSEIMVGSRSGFSYTAGLVNPGKIYFPDGFWHTVPENWELF
jgi:hypothetical protein